MRMRLSMAAILGKSDEATKYDKLFEEVRQTWIDRYVTPDGLIVAQTQTAYVLGLHFDLLPEEVRPKVVEASTPISLSRRRRRRQGSPAG